MGKRGVRVSLVGLVIGCAIFFSDLANGQCTTHTGVCVYASGHATTGDCFYDGSCCASHRWVVGRAFCDELISSSKMNNESWMRPFTGLDENGDTVDKHFWDHFCNRNNPKVYRMQPTMDKLDKSNYGFGSLDQYTNRLQFKVDYIAQEGLSFCIIGSHYRRSPFALWEPLKGFLPIAEKSFDIGNHIDPEDSTKMNTFRLPNSESLRYTRHDVSGTHRDNIWSSKKNPILIPTHRFEYVWLGLQNVDDQHLGGPDTEVPLVTGFKKRPAHPEWQPDPRCSNPYRVAVTMIEADGLALHNYLHIKVHAEPVSQSSGRNCPTGKIKLLMLEVRDQDGLPVGQFTDEVTCEKDEKTTGQALQCHNQGKTTCKAHYGTKRNQVPCMFTHPKAVVHPTIFMFSATDDSSGGSPPGPAPGPPATPVDPCRNSQIPQNQRNPPNTKYEENDSQYVTEVHATWRYAQMDDGWASELHFATMIIEDEKPIQYYTSRLSIWDGVSSSESSTQYATKHPQWGWCQWGRYDCCWRYSWPPPQYRQGRIQLGLINTCWNETYNTNRPYGYSARYTAIKPTFNTLGGWDYFRKEYISPKDVNCHVDIRYEPDGYYTLKDEPVGKFSVLPIRKTLKDFLKDKFTLENPSKYQPPVREGNKWRETANYRNTYELPDWHNFGVTMHTDVKNFPSPNDRVKLHWYLADKAEHAALKMFDSAHQDPIVLKNEFDDRPHREYFGTRHCVPENEQVHPDVTKLKETVVGEDHQFTMEEMALDPKSRCPCPFVPTTLPPELATKPPVEIEGRRAHAVNMLLAWAVLVPLAFFVARFFKETYSRVFFLQEFWWYMIHVLCLITAILFTGGAIYALEIKRTLGEPYEIVWTDATKAHIYLGYTVIGLFAIQLLFGGFRLYDIELRIIQIGLHWLFGWLTYLCAMAVILSAAAIPSGIMSCITFGIYCAFIVFQLAFTLGMEIHLRRVDQELNLDPPRAYLPPPMMRLFHKDAPHSFFRICMLIIYASGCFLFYVAMHVSLNLPGGEYSCFQPTFDAGDSQEVEL